MQHDIPVSKEAVRLLIDDLLRLLPDKPHQAARRARLFQTMYLDNGIDDKATT